MVSDRVDARVGGGVRGRVGLQLCDSRTGRVVHAVERENYVARRMLDVPAEFARFGIVGVEGSGSSPTTWMPADGAFRHAPFTGLVLTDHDGPIDLNERGIGGAVTGYASKGVSGAGSARGTYNALESEHRFDYHRFVYDFATTEANGTIQSIYTGPWDAAGTITHGVPLALVPPALDRNAGATLANQAVTYDRLTGTAYRWTIQTATATGNNTMVERAPLLDFLMGGVRATPWATEALPTGGYSALAVKGARLYWLDQLRGTGTSRTLSIYSAPVADLQSHTLERTLDAAFLNSIGWTNNNSHLRGMAYLPDRDTFVLGNISSAAGAPTAALYELDPNDGWALLRAFNGPRTDSNGAISSLPGSPNEIMVGSTISRLDNIAGTVTPKGEIAVIVGGPIRSATELVDGMGACLIRSSGSNGQTWFIPVQQFFSRARLDEPVVKTSTLTMKITYEFTFDPPVWMP